MSPMISVVSWAAGPTSAPVIPKTFHNPGTAFDGGGGGGGGGYSSDSGSTYFDGTGDYLSIDNNLNFYSLGTSDWAIEFWVYVIDLPDHRGVFQLGKDVGALCAMIYTDGKIKLIENDQAVVFESNSSLSTNKWYHIAFTNDRTGSNNIQRLYINGIAQTNTGTKNTAFSYSDKTTFIGGRWYSNSFQKPLKGYISNFRIVGGSYVHPPASGGGSTYFDGTDDLLKVANNTSFRLGTGDFTIETWVYFDDTSLEGGSNRRIFNLHESGNAVDTLQILVDDGSYRKAGDLFLYSNSIQGYLDTDIRSGWHHIAVVRNSGTLKFYLDGVSKYSASNTQDYSPGGLAGPRPVIGSRGDDKGDYKGYLSNFRMVIGTAVYTSNFTPSTTPLTDITNTQLLTCQNYTGSITDESSNAHVISETGGVNATYSSPFVESKTELTAITNTQLLTCQNSTGTITDASSNGYNITANGDADAHPFDPFTNIGSTYFDGTGDALNLGQIDGTALELGGLTHFTVEGWWKASTSMSLSSTQWNALISMPWHGQTNANSQIWIGWAGSAYGTWNLSAGEFYIGLYMSDGTYETLNSSNTTIYNDDAWHHFALVKNGTSYSLFVDGVRTEEITTSKTLNTSLGTKIGYIGGYNSSNINVGERFDFNGYVSNVRVSSTARYSGTTVALPNSSFTSDANTLFLTCQNGSGAITDASSNNRTITKVGNAIADPTNPFGSTSGSAYFDGSGDSLDVGTFTIGTDAFTIENWFQPKFNTSGSDTVFLYDVSSEDIRVTFKNGNIRAQLGSETELSYSIGTLDYNTWYYTALQRDSSGNVNFYFDGGVVGNYSASGQNVSGNTLRIGDKQAGSKEFHGYISNFRIVKGNALYPPANGGSASFDGTGDSIDATNPLSGTGDFTMEGWIYPTTSGLYDGYFSTCLNTGDSGGIVVAKDKFFITHGGGSSQIGFSSSIENNVWSHIVLKRSSNVFSLYKDGILQGTTTVTVSLTGSTVRLGSRYTNTTTYQLTGFLSNFRIVTGTNVYSGSYFTPPTSPLTAISGTQLLTCQNGTGTITDASSNNYTITTNGDASASGSSPFAKSTTPLTDITNTKLLTCNNQYGVITDASSNNHTVTTNGNTIASTLNPFDS